MYGTFWALLPPIVAIVLALITKETYSSLFLGIVVGALFVGGFNPVDSLNSMLNDGFIGAIADGWNAGIFMFLVLLGIMVALINSAGGSAAFGRWAVKHVHSRAGAIIATVILGVLIFVDDYFNCLTVGSVMRPVTDSHKVSRAKLAYIIDATAAPICMIAPVSSWAAAVSATAQDLDTGVSGIQLFIQAIPYNFYSLLTIVFVIAITVMGFDYGPMAKAEFKALQGELGSLGNDDETSVEGASIWDMLLPVIVLIVFCVIGMMYVGGFWDGASLIDSFADTDASVGLPWGCIIALLVTFVYLLCRRVITFKDATACITKGFVAMVPALLILTFALTLKNMTGLLGADVYVAGLVKGAADSLFSMLPAIIFLVAVGLAFATGTSWGTFGILIPIVLPVFADAPDLLMIGISACLAGAVCGDHCSPISDTTIMASAGANCNHIEHVSTQLPYALTVAAVCFVNFILAGFIRNAVICLAIGIVLILATLFVIRGAVNRKNGRNA
ncbi:MAG: Na+/H+ antiporter NhaC family protein [Candidatus Limivicinus sp.]|nr:Na+/H+ antiporter NhaC family protein [Clostridiales bacterium]MDY3859785.1 Na+/H+ antiporter NhaC family protein [Candidatus Limivicinus sp.]